jgi:hypothetical protein
LRRGGFNPALIPMVSASEPFNNLIIIPELLDWSQLKKEIKLITLKKPRHYFQQSRYNSVKLTSGFFMQVLWTE